MADFPRDAFADVVANNKGFAAGFDDQGLSGYAAQGLAIITCMDSRIAPLAIVGMQPGDVKILRNAGARVTDDVLRTLVLATFLLVVGAGNSGVDIACDFETLRIFKNAGAKDLNPCLGCTKYNISLRN